LRRAEHNDWPTDGDSELSESQLIGLLQQQNQDLQAKLECMSKTGDDA
jgi:hypothetical protein